MDILGNLVGGQACAADGTAAARNPLSRLVDTLMEGSAGGQQQKGRTRRSFNPQQHHQSGAAIVRASPPGSAAASAAHAHAHAQGMSRGMMQEGMAMGAPPPMGASGQQWMGPPGSNQHQQVCLSRLSTYYYCCRVLSLHVHLYLHVYLYLLCSL